MIKKIQNKYAVHKETVINFLWRALQLLGKEGVTFLIFFISVKILSPYDFGLYNYLLSIIILIIMFSDFGITGAASKFAAEYNINDKSKLKTLLFNSGLIILVITLIISLLIVLFGRQIFPDHYKYLLLLLPMVFFASMSSLLDGIYRGLKRFKELALKSLIVGAFSIPIIYYLIYKYGIYGALLSQNIFYIVLFIVLIQGHGIIEPKINKSIMKEIGVYSALIGITSIGNFLYTRIDVIILGQFHYITEIGYYEIVMKMFTIMVLPFMILGQVLAPTITEEYVRNLKSRVLSKFNRYAIIFGLSGIIISLFAFYAFPIIAQILFKQYADTGVVFIFQLLLITLPIRIASSVVVTAFLNSTGHASIMSYTTIIYGICNAIMDVIFISTYGFQGVFYSTIILAFFSFGTIVVSYNIRLRKNIQNETKK